MAKTPNVKGTVKVDMDHPAIKDALKQAEKQGYEDGLQRGRVEVLDWLEHAYVNDSGRPDRGSPRAEAILAVASEAADHFRKIVKREKKRGKK